MSFFLQAAVFTNPQERQSSRSCDSFDTNLTGEVLATGICEMTNSELSNIIRFRGFQSKAVDNNNF